MIEVMTEYFILIILTDKSGEAVIQKDKCVKLENGQQDKCHIIYDLFYENDMTLATRKHMKGLHQHIYCRRTYLVKLNIRQRTGFEEERSMNQNVVLLSMICFGSEYLQFQKDENSS